MRDGELGDTAFCLITYAWYQEYPDLDEFYQGICTFKFMHLGNVYFLI
jgi:hypothetical protein